jgi:hypothetical protein
MLSKTIVKYKELIKAPSHYTTNHNKWRPNTATINTQIDFETWLKQFPHKRGDLIVFDSDYARTHGADVNALSLVVDTITKLHDITEWGYQVGDPKSLVVCGMFGLAQNNAVLPSARYESPLQYRLLTDEETKRIVDARVSDYRQKLLEAYVSS